MNAPTWLDFVLAGISVIAAGVAIWQAIVAKKAAHDAKVDASANMYLKLSEKYEEAATSGVFDRLRDFKDKQDGKTLDERINAWAVYTKAGPAKQLDRDRRVGELFHQAAVLVLQGALQPAWVDEIKRWSGKTLVRDVVFPMNRAKQTRLGTPAMDAMDFEKKIEKVFFS